MSIKSELQALRSLVYRRLYMSKRKRANVTDSFHSLFYDSFLFDKTWGESTWLGVHIKKCPFDTWMYQEILFEVKPDLIVECGTYKGGSAYYMATLCDLIGKGEILTIDIEDHPNKPQHARIKYLTGSTLDPVILGEVNQAVYNKQTVLVILDDDHTRDHVLKEMETYAPFVTIGSYMLVEDSNVNGHPVYPEFGPGPYEAIEAFLSKNDKFAIDKSKEKFYMTFNPNGYLRRIK
ncbi:MAG: CmcI family methyltransferase [Chitinophagales bacterium]